MMQAPNDVLLFLEHAIVNLRENELIDFRFGGRDCLEQQKATKCMNALTNLNFKALVALQIKKTKILIRCHSNKRVGLQTGCMLLMDL